jgi:ribonuclease P protein component
LAGEFRFPRQARLTRRREYLKVYKKGRKTVGKAFICHHLPDREGGRQLGLAVSRKVGNAVVRNRVKRLAREVFRLHQHQLPLHVRVVLVARPSAAQMDFWQCKDAVLVLWRRAGLIHG